MNDESNIEPVSSVGKASGSGRWKMTSYSEDKLKEQALLLNKIRRSHARGAMALIRSMGVLVKRMKRIDAEVQRTITKNLRAIGDEIANVEDQGFEHKEYSFERALEKVNEVLDEAQAVADAPPLP
jgi:DNA mismatch repair ATPase MutS